MIETPLTAEPSLIDFYPDFYTEPKSQPKEIKADNLEFTKCRRFGISYMGSKNQIVKALISQLPSAKYFIDLFAGGCAMTHGAMLSGKYERFIANDISDAPSLFQRAINGEFRDEKRWISRDDFFALKDSDPYVRYIWSFGNKGAGYLYSKEIEPYKKAYHFARFGDFSLFDEFAPYVKNECGENLRAYIAKNNDKIKADYMRWYLETKLNIKGKELEKAINGTKSDLENEGERLRAYLCDALKSSGLTQSAVNKHLGTQMAGHYFGKSQWQFPTFEEYKKIQEILPLNKSYFECVNFLYALHISLESLQSLQSLQNLESLQSLERLQSLQNLERLERLQNLERLERLQNLERLERVEIHQGCYKEVELPEPTECVIYCDPPYINSEGYHKQTLKNGKTSFNHGEFYDYVESLARQGYKIFISEYEMPKDRFKSVFFVEKRQTLNGKGAGAIKQEHLFIPII